MTRPLYLDNCSTTEPDYPKLVDATAEVCLNFGNPSSGHSLGNDAKDLLEQARERVAKSLDAKPSSIVFTSGGTEANSMVMKQFSCFRKIVSGCEHSSVFNAGDIRIPIHPTGELDFNFLESQLKSAISTTLVSVMMVNHETGVILDPENRLAELKKKYSFVLHVDAVQAYGKMPISLSALDHIDFLTVSAHKVHGLKGVGALYVNGRNSPLAPLFTGGSQERGMRPGTPNMLGIVHFGLVVKELSKWINNLSVKTLRDAFESSISDFASVNGKDAPRIGNISNITFKDTNFSTVEELQLFLETLSERGLFVSGTSACSTGFGEPSRTLLSMYGSNHYNLFNSIRIGFPNNYVGDTHNDIISQVLDNLKHR